MDVVALLKRLVQFPSLSTREDEIAAFLESYVQHEGFAVHRRDNNLWFSLGEGNRRLLLNSHLDVVPPSEGHPHPPFAAVEEDGRLFGRGSVDAKASGAAMTTAVLELHREGWSAKNGSVLVALTACEETGGPYNGLDDLRPHLPPLSAALVGEPTEMQPCVAQKGLLILTARASGTSAHAARAHLGDNAIQRAARDILRVADLRFDKSDSFLGTPTVAVTTVDGGKARNVVPDECTFTLDVRSTPAYSHDELTALFSEMLESDVRVHSDRIVPVATDLSQPIIQACLAARADASPFGSPTASDWIFLRDVPTVKIGPGDSRLSHTASESIPVAEVRRAVDIYKRIIVSYFEQQV